MNQLLALRLNTNAAVLLQDWTASCLIDCFLTDSFDQRSKTFRQLLSVDPSWLLWSVTTLQDTESLSAGLFANLASCPTQQIQQRISECLTNTAVSDEQLAALQKQSVQAIQNGRRAKQTAISNNDDEPELSFIVGALRGCEQLLVQENCETGDGESTHSEKLPAWLESAIQEGDVLGIIEGQQQVQTSDATIECDNGSSLVPEIESSTWHSQFPPIRALLPKAIAFCQHADDQISMFERKLEIEKLAALKELAYGASHEINNPLANISTRAQSLIQNESNPERRRQLATITSQAFRAHEMIADMMLFAKPPQPEFISLDLVHFVKELADSIQTDMDMANAHVSVFLPTASILIHADKAQLDAALRAIVKNSVEASGGSGNIEVRIEQENADERFVEIEIRDDGPGISREIRKHLFDPFFSGREAGRGLGFGLSKAWRIIELHNGKITVTSDAGVGTSISVFLPTSQNANECSV